MAISLKTSLVFMFITSLLVCAKVKFTGLQNGKDPEDYWTEFTVAFYDGETKAESATLSRSLSQNDSHVCILKNQSFFLRLQSFYQVNSKEELKFDISIDSKKYEGGGYDISHKDLDKKELCFTWGTWKPNLNRTTKTSNFFFDIITQEDVIKRGYFFVIDTRINNSLFSVDLRVYMFDSVSLKSPKYFPRFFLVALAENTDEAYKTKVTFLNDKRYTGEGNGDMVIPMMLSEQDVEEVEKTIGFAKGSKDNCLRDLARLNKDNIIFKEEGGFEIRKPFKNYITQSMQILI